MHADVVAAREASGGADVIDLAKAFQQGSCSEGITLDVLPEHAGGSGKAWKNFMKKPSLKLKPSAKLKLSLKFKPSARLKLSLEQKQ